ncbi:MAG: glycosyltransferase family 4 protein [Candidatus Binataceae bacterium]
MRLRLCFVVESGTDVRMVEGMASRFTLSVLARRIGGGVEISRPPDQPMSVTVGPSSRIGFARVVFNYLRARRFDFDHVVVQGYGTAAVAANLAGRITAVPTTMMVCSPVEAYYRCRALTADSDKPFRRRELLGLLAAARVNARIGYRYVVLSQYLRDVVRGHGTRKPIHVIPVYGVDTLAFSPSTKLKRELKALRGLPETGAIILFSSRIAPEKDADTLLAAFRELILEGRDLWLLHRSGGYQSFLAAARRFSIDHRVIATDAVDPRHELPNDYRAADLCVQASREEGLGFSVLESMACGIPVVAAETGGLRETVVDGETGWLFPAGDFRALAGCVRAALDDPVEARKRAIRGRELVCLRFDESTSFANFESAIRLSATR